MSTRKIYFSLAYGIRTDKPKEYSTMVYPPPFWQFAEGIPDQDELWVFLYEIDREGYKIVRQR